MTWFTKARRAQSTEDYETWAEGLVSPTLSAFDNTGDSRATVVILSEAGPRMLTPLEMERMMGWPDNHTLQRADGKINSAGTRVRMIGNGVASPVATWIAERINDLYSTPSE
jgi:site-specific DNA-cytosine methylase